MKTTPSPTWKALEEQAEALKRTSLSALFKDDAKRFDHYSVQAENIFFDFSKNLIDNKTLGNLFDLLQEADFEDWRNRMFLGEQINTTDKRSVLHAALRSEKPLNVNIDGQDVSEDVRKTLENMRKFTRNVRDKTLRGHSGKAFSHIVHIGIGGSQLGPEMVVDALSEYATPDLTCDFVSNVDGHDIDRIIKRYSPETTLFLIASKSFTTQETMLNATVARDWITDHYGSQDAVKDHFVALSTNEDAVNAFGIQTERMFPFWDWVGGRYSLWSSIGLCVALMIGMDRFEDLLAGASQMDQHFKEADTRENLPVLLALIGVWNRNFLKFPAYTVVPYDHRLSRLPLWLQQVDMESNGKTVDRQGLKVSVATGPLVFGGPGTDVQHSYFQWMHQGTDTCPADFIICARPDHKHAKLHRTLMTHFLAQQRALMEGISDPDAPHRDFPGNRPSNALILDSLTPYTLGQLLALYEHKIFVQGIIWNINSFDQYGVELGKTMAGDIQDNWSDFKGRYDSSTEGQLEHLKTLFE